MSKHLSVKQGFLVLLLALFSCQTAPHQVTPPAPYSASAPPSCGQAVLTVPTAPSTGTPSTPTPTSTVTPTGTLTPPAFRIYLPIVLKAWPPVPTPTATAAATPTKVQTGNVYYVALNGNDANPGTEILPFATMSKGVSVLTAGDTLYVKSGTYLQTATLNITKSGRADARITISTAPAEPSLAIISGDTNGNGTTDASDTPANNKYGSLVLISGSYITLQNFEVAYSGGRTVDSDGANNIISGNNIHHAWNNGIYVAGPGNTVENNLVWRAADSNYCGGVGGSQGCNGDWSAGIAWGWSKSSAAPGIAPYTIIRGNTVYNNSGEGILGMHTDYGLVEGNVVYDNWALDIYLDQCSYTTIQKNLVYYTDDKMWWRWTDKPGPGIMLSNEGITGYAGRMYPVAHDRIVVNNMVIGTGFNFDFWSGYQSGSALINDIIAYNTFVEAQGIDSDGIHIDAALHTNTRIVNNLILQSMGAIASVGSTSGLTFDHNLWSRTPPSGISGPSDVIGNPLLIDPNYQRNPGAVVPDWYKLTSGSPALGKGVNLTSVIDDYFGTLRSMPPDIGAHEYQ